MPRRLPPAGDAPRGDPALRWASSRAASPRSMRGRSASLTSRSWPGSRAPLAPRPAARLPIPLRPPMSGLTTRLAMTRLAVPRLIRSTPRRRAAPAASTSARCWNSPGSTRLGRFGHDCTHARHADDAAAVLEEQVQAAERNRCELIPCEGASWPCVALSTPSPPRPSRRRPSLSPGRRAPVTTARAPVASPMHGSRSPVMPSTSEPCPPPVGRAPISSSPPRWRR